MEQFQYYLDGQQFTLETDHNNMMALTAINSIAREQGLARIRDLKKAETRGRVEQHHAEFKQLVSQTKGATGLFEVILHRTVARTEEEEEIGETE